MQCGGERFFAIPLEIDRLAVAARSAEMRNRIGASGGASSSVGVVTLDGAPVRESRDQQTLSSVFRESSRDMSSIFDLHECSRNTLVKLF